ncbi:MAG: ABC transporter substrate-binding protein [Hyphomicrobiaceae bacterium]|nr:ABC transporter substrate-binding protein [Hyphomicrobiaceae bacterium]
MIGQFWRSKCTRIAAASALALLLAPVAHAEQTGQPTKRHHGLSLLGEPKLPADFKHFDWVNPDAPKGGRLKMWDLGSFDSLNPFSVRGDAATGLQLIYDSLMASNPDEPSAEYGLVAEWVSYPADYSSATFALRPGARFHDGKPITPEDVIFSLEAVKRAHPRYAFYYKNVSKVEKTGEREVTFTFDMKGNRELPHIIGQLNVLPRHFWEGKTANGEPRDITKSSLEVPLGSGPYKIKSVDPGRSLVYERVKDYWAADVPASRGQWNYDEIAYTYYRDATPAFEAFKAGNIDVWFESSANRWATQYTFEAVDKGWVKKEAIKHQRVAVMQAFVLNTRKPQFADARVRRAFNLAFDFNSLNKNLFYGLYVRAGSFFANSELAARGLPEGRELEILEKVRDAVPPEVFTTVWENPSSTTPLEHRNNMREAVRLVREAGYTMKGGVLVNAAGEPLKAEFLLVQPDFERIVLPYIEDLKKIGVQASVRIVDTSQYKRRTDDFDYDVIVDSFAQSHSPGNEQRDYWGSAAAGRSGSNNTIGIRNPAIDKIIDMIVSATDRADLIAATRALDRVLLWNNYVVPQWNYPYDRVAYWDVLGRPERLPSQQPGVVPGWWIDPAKVKALEAARGR